MRNANDFPQTPTAETNPYLEDIRSWDWPAIKAELDCAEPEDQEEWEAQARRIYLGSVLSLTPSGKIYAPFACSNVEPCSRCQGRGKTRPKGRGRKRARKKAEKRARERSWALRTHAMRVYGAWYPNGERWPEVIKLETAKLDKIQAFQDCHCCYGLGSQEAYHDSLFNEALKTVAGEQDCCLDWDSGDIFLGKTVGE